MNTKFCSQYNRKCFQWVYWQKQLRQHQKKFQRNSIQLLDVYGGVVVHNAKLSSAIFLADNYFSIDQVLSLQPLLQYPVIVLIIALLLYYFIPKLFKASWNYVVLPGIVIFICYVIFQNPYIFLESVEGVAEFVVGHPISTSVVILVVLAFLLSPYVLVIGLIYLLITGTTLVKPVIEPFLPPFITQVEKSLETAQSQVTGFYNQFSGQQTTTFQKEKQRTKTDDIYKNQKALKENDQPSKKNQQQNKQFLKTDKQTTEKYSKLGATLQPLKKQGLKIVDATKEELPIIKRSLQKQGSKIADVTKKELPVIKKSLQKQGQKIVNQSKKEFPIVKSSLQKQGQKILEEAKKDLPIIKKQGVKLVKTIKQKTPGALEKSKNFFKFTKQKGSQIINKGKKAMENISQRSNQKNESEKYLQQKTKMKEIEQSTQNLSQKSQRILAEQENKINIEKTQLPIIKKKDEVVGQEFQQAQKERGIKQQNVLGRDNNQKQIIPQKIQNKFKKSIKKREQIVGGDQVVERILNNS